MTTYFTTNSKLIPNILTPKYYGKIDRFMKDLLIYEFMTYLPSDLLSYSDRSSMAASVEFRAPFLENNLINYILTMPPKYNIGLRGNGKKLLTETYKTYLPKQILKRRKQGFGQLTGNWMSNHEKDLISEYLDSPWTIKQSLIKKVSLNKILYLHLNKNRDYSRVLWGLFALEEWAKRFN